MKCAVDNFRYEKRNINTDFLTDEEIDFLKNNIPIIYVDGNMTYIGHGTETNIYIKPSKFDFKTSNKSLTISKNQKCFGDHTYEFEFEYRKNKNERSIYQGTLNDKFMIEKYTGAFEFIYPGGKYVNIFIDDSNNVVILEKDRKYKNKNDLLYNYHVRDLVNGFIISCETPEKSIELFEMLKETYMSPDMHYMKRYIFEIYKLYKRILEKLEEVNINE